jgi:hypothetical protein
MAIVLCQTHPLKIATLLQIASRVKATMEAYTPVHSFAD